MFPGNRKTPETLRFRGILRLDTMYLAVLYIYKFVLISDYSMIVATRPDPTVRPPSRYQTDVLRCTNGGFSCDSCGKSGFSVVSVLFFLILLSWCYRI